MSHFKSNNRGGLEIDRDSLHASPKYKRQIDALQSLSKAKDMTDMHREAFERVAKADGFNIKRDKYLKEEYAETSTHFAFAGWRLALRYRDEQEKGDEAN